jgi:hypothetical protein
MARGVTGDAEVMDLLLRFDEPDVAVEVLSRWRRQRDRALLARISHGENRKKAPILV